MSIIKNISIDLNEEEVEKMEELKDEYLERGLISKDSDSALLRYLLTSAHELSEKEKELNEREEEIIKSYDQIKSKKEDYQEELSFSHKWFLLAGALMFIVGFLIRHFLI